MVRTATLGTNSKKLDPVVSTVQDLQVKVTEVEKNVTAVEANALKIQSQSEKNFQYLQLLAKGQKLMLEKLCAIEASSASSASSAQALDTDEADKNAPMSSSVLCCGVEEGHLTYNSLFTSVNDGGKICGVKIGVVFFRQLALHPYPTERELLITLLKFREGIKTDLVKAWFKLHRTKIFQAFRDKRASYLRSVRLHVAKAMDGTPPPTGRTNKMMRDWRLKSKPLWKSALKQALHDGLYFPAAVTEAARSIARQWDKRGKYCEETDEDDCEEAFVAASLVVLEAFALICCTITFNHVDLQCTAQWCGGECLKQAIVTVKGQREKVTAAAAVRADANAAEQEAEE